MSIRINKKRPCPVCQRLFRGYTHDGKKMRPSPGDLCVCYYCVTMLKFDDQLQLQKLTTAEFEALPKENQDELNQLVLKIVKDHPYGNTF